MSERKRKALRAFKEAKEAAERYGAQVHDSAMRAYLDAAEAAWGVLAEVEELALKEAEGER
jgi:hypothetical protein